MAVKKGVVDVVGVWSPTEQCRDVFRVDILTELRTNARTLTKKQRKTSEPIVGMITWTLLTDGKDMATGEYSI